MQFLNRARTRRKIFIRIFGINTHFHRMTRQMNITLAQSEFLSRSNANLLFYQINACDKLCYPVFYLNPRVDFHKIKLSVAV